MMHPHPGKKIAFYGIALGALLAVVCFLHAHPVFAAADCSEYGSGVTCASSCGTGQSPVGPATNCSGICCFAAPPAPAQTAGGGLSPAQPQGSGAVTLFSFLPSDVQQCFKTGNCSLDQIVETGAAFANLLTQISAALFFATFVYGGAMYLLSFGDKKRVEKGKQAITGSAIGMAIVLGAWTLVNYIAGSLLGKL